MGWMEFVLAVATLVLGTGWLFTWRAHKRQENAKARQSELEATKTEQDMYQEMLEDVRGHNDVLRKFNKEISEECEMLRQRITENEKCIREQDDKIRKQDEKLREQENKIATLEHRLELVTDMMCGKSNCQQRTKVFLSPVDDDSFGTRKDK